MAEAEDEGGLKATQRLLRDRLLVPNEKWFRENKITGIVIVALTEVQDKSGIAGFTLVRADPDVGVEQVMFLAAHQFQGTMQAVQQPNQPSIVIPEGAGNARRNKGH